MKPSTIYLCGPMRGYPYYNHRAFDGCQKLWEDHGHTVISPAEHDRNQGCNPYELPLDYNWSKHWDTYPLADCYGWDIEAILRRANCIALLPGWENSIGSRGEIAVGLVAGHHFYDAFSMKRLRIEVDMKSTFAKTRSRIRF